MTPAASHVLLLGWDDTPRTGEQSAPAVFPLVQALAPQIPLAIVLPRRPAALVTTPNTHLTVLSELTPADLLATAQRPDTGPAAWQAPAAPYVGSSSSPLERGLAIPAEPYVGRSPQAPAPDTGAAMVTTGLAASAAEASQRSAAASATTTQPEGGLLDHDDFEDNGAEPKAAEAYDLSQPQDDMVQDAVPKPAPTPLPSAPLPDGLAALQLTPEPDADLNYQVIQYARFATRQSFLENFSVIYATDWPTWLAAMEIRQQTGRPLVLHVHSLAQDRNTAADRGWIQELERLTMRRADLVLAASDDIAQRLRETYPLLVKHLQVVHPDDTNTLTNTLRQLETTWAGR
ncbi:Glycosyl transferase 4-like domain-containing protein [Hymenobacter gelipurpurascens]|uniref:Glycosyl transferase 4-like domain-containing protein n=1 Tax=Hymenobacter gelipurpurascens TaxID=89968 RepID=A0A212U8T1_9BACT|nr:glycosyltransferase family 4 protein [Hymenobacter gelipurpurascens]SNC74626.1 Glycosyl transferase 4-like domain-containing protein [Hymenobacter gelipurpurascens]